MADIFIGLVKRLVIFLLAGETILHFGMGKRYEHYVRLIISLMVVAQLLSGIMGIYASHKDRGFFLDEERLRFSFEERWKSSIREFEEDMEDKQQRIEENWKGISETAGEGVEMQQEEQQIYHQKVYIEEIHIP